MNIEDIKKFIDENKEDEQVQQFIEGLQVKDTIDVQRIEKLTQDDDEIRAWFDSQRDKHSSKALETWKQNHLDKLVDEKMKELNPDKSPEQIELERIKQELDDMKNQKLKEELKNKALTVATEKSIPTNLVDFFLGQDEESTTQNLATFEEAMQSYVNEQVKKRISDSSYEPPADDGAGKGFTKEQVASMSAEEINKHWDEVKDLV